MNLLGTIKRPDKIEAIHNLLYKPKDARDTRFHLYTRRNPHKGQELMIGNKKSLLLSSFKPESPIKFIISGWLDNRFFAKWVRMAIQSLLLHGDYNVIYVSWRSIKELFVAAMMIKLFSADLAQFIIFLKVSIYIIIMIIIIIVIIMICTNRWSHEQCLNQFKPN